LPGQPQKCHRLEQHDCHRHFRWRPAQRVSGPTSFDPVARLGSPFGVLIPVQSGTAYARYFAMSLTTRMRISRNTLRRGVESRLVPVFLATVIEGDVDALESFSALSFGLPGIGLAVSAGQFDIVGEGSQQGTRVEAI